MLNIFFDFSKIYLLNILRPDKIWTNFWVFERSVRLLKWWERWNAQLGYMEC